jgi:hypothetical protein
VAHTNEKVKEKNREENERAAMMKWNSWGNKNKNKKSFDRRGMSVWIFKCVFIAGERE